MKLRTILNETDMDALRSQIAKARDAVDADDRQKQAASDADRAQRSEVSSQFERLHPYFNSAVRFRAMLYVLGDKGSKAKQKSRGNEFDPENGNIDYDEITSTRFGGETVYNDMVKTGLLTKRGGITDRAVKYLEYVGSENIGSDHEPGEVGKSSTSPNNAAAPGRFNAPAADKLTSRGEKGNFPRGVNSEFFRSDAKARRQSGQVTHGNSRDKLLGKVEQVLGAIKGRVNDRTRRR